MPHQAVSRMQEMRARLSATEHPSCRLPRVKRCSHGHVLSAAETREAEREIREAQQKQQELQSECEALSAALASLPSSAHCSVQHLIAHLDPHHHHLCAAEAREAERKIREAQQKQQELQSGREALRHKAQETRAAEQVRSFLLVCQPLQIAAAWKRLGGGSGHYASEGCIRGVCSPSRCYPASIMQ